MNDINGDGWTVMSGSCLDRLGEIPDSSIEAIVTDPPYGLSNTDPKHVAQALARWGAGERDFIPDGRGFMGKAWDAFVPPPAVWDECLRVLKPGGHLLAFAGSRTFDLMALSVRLAGFEIRDSIAWLYGSGFPKSLNIGKSIEAKLTTGSAAKNGFHKLDGKRTGEGKIGMYATVAEQGFRSHNPEQLGAFDLEATTSEAQKWAGWGTALKPAFEPIVVARKPLTGTVAANVLEWGTGGLNIDGSRIGTETIEQRQVLTRDGKTDSGRPGVPQVANGVVTTTQGRWPANVMLDEYTAALLDEQSGVSKSAAGVTVASPTALGQANGWNPHNNRPVGFQNYGDSGGASRFFYVAKASKRDRNEGLDELDEQEIGAKGNGLACTCATCSASVLDGCQCPDRTFINPTRKNFHPTVKPTTLMRYLIKLVTPPGGTVLDPFTGSGSTGKAAILEGFKFIGVELTEEYFPIIEGRLKHAEETANTIDDEIELW